jgi:hypothetical protein
MNIIGKILSRFKKKEPYHYEDSPLDAYARMVHWTGESWEHYWGIEEKKK